MIIIPLALLVGLLLILARSRSGPARRGPGVGPLGWVSSTDWSVMVPLARIETVRLVRHPGFIAGIAFTLLTLTLATARDAAGDEWVRVSAGVGLGLAPLGWFSIAAAQLLTTRPRRTGADALLDSLPAPEPSRTAGLLAAAVGPTVVATVLAAGFVVWRARQGGIVGTGPDFFEIAAGPLIVGGGAVVGVALGRFLPHPTFAVAGAIAVILIQARFGEPTTWPWNAEESSPVRMLAFLGAPTSADAALEFRPAAWHALYLVGLIALMAVVALARSGMSRLVTGGLVASLVLIAPAAWAQTRPVPDTRIAEMVRYLEDPLSHQDCATRDGVEFCVDERGRRDQPVWRERITAMTALVPGAFEGRTLRVHQRVPTVTGNGDCAPVPYRSTLITAVAEAMDPATVWSADGAIHPGVDTLPCSATSVHGFFFATQVGLWAVGLPPSPWGLDQRCRADGQARAVLALWLGAAVSPQGEATLRKLVEEDSSSSVLSFAGWNDPPMWGVQFAAADARLALELLERPTAEVATVVAQEWQRLTSSDTPSSMLADLAGADGVSVAPTAAARGPQLPCR